MAMDIGIAWLGDPMGFYDLAPQVQTDLTAFHLIATSRGSATRETLVAAAQRTNTELLLDTLTVVQGALKLQAKRYGGDIEADLVSQYVKEPSDTDERHRRSVSRRLQTESGATADAAGWWLEHD